MDLCTMPRGVNTRLLIATNLIKVAPNQSNIREDHCTPLLCKKETAVCSYISTRYPAKFPFFQICHSLLQDDHSSSLLHNNSDQITRIEAIVQMMRLQNYVPSFALVPLGAWIGSSKDISVFTSPSVWIVAVCSALIAAASMLINDYYDFRSGADRGNSRSSAKALDTGKLDPDDVALCGGCIYGVTMVGAACVSAMRVRIVVVMAAFITFIYTPLLKKLLVVKNLVVATVVASSILVGAMASSAPQALAQTYGPSISLFLGIMGREILMDVKDILGDKIAGIETLATRFGCSKALLIAHCCFLASHLFLVGCSPLGSWKMPLSCLVYLPLHSAMLTVMNPTPSNIIAMHTVEEIINKSMFSFILGLMITMF